MANIFDQIDPPKTAGPAAPASTSPGAAPANVFDTIDPPAASPTAKLPTAGESLLNTLGSVGRGVVKTIPHLVESTADLLAYPLYVSEAGGSSESGTPADWAERERQMNAFLLKNYGPPDPAKPNSYTDEQRKAAYQSVIASGAAPAPRDNPAPSTIIRKGLDAINANPDTLLPTPDDPASRMIEMGTEGALSMLAPLPGGKKQGIEKLYEIARNLIIGGGGGLAAAGAMEVVSDEYKPLAGIVAGLGGAGVTHLGLKGVEIPVKRAVNSPIFTRDQTGKTPEAAAASNTGRLAAEQLGRDVTDREAAIANLQTPDAIPNSALTSAQKSRDVGLKSREAAMARSGDDHFKEMLIERRQQESQAQLAALDEVQNSGSPAEVSNYFNRRMAELNRQADELHAGMANLAQERINALGDPHADEVGARARGAVAARLKDVNDETNALWKSIDPNKTLIVPTNPMIRATSKVYGNLGPEAQIGLMPIEKQIAGIIGTYPETLPFQRFSDLRALINNAMAEAARTNPTAYGRLKQLRSSIEEAVADGVNNKIGEDQNAIAQGTMSEDDALAANFMRQAKEWYANKGQEAGAGAYPGDAVPEARGPTAVPRDLGAAREAPSGPPVAAGDQGLSQNAGEARLTPEDGGQRYSDANGTTAWLGENGDIHEFSSGKTRMGQGRFALQNIKSKIGHAPRVIDPGAPGTASFRFWEKMQEEGLVSDLLDEDQQVIKGAENATKQRTTGEQGVRPAPGEPAVQPRLEGREADGSLRGLPRRISNKYTASADPAAQAVAQRYMEKAGLPYKPPNTYAKVSPVRARRIADAYEQMKHDPQNPEVQRAYNAMIDETLAQYQAMLDDGMKIEFIPEGAPDPYEGNPRNMTEDVRNNKHMWVFPTKSGFGSDATFDASDNPLLRETPFQISGQTATANDIFRAVHDYFGHVKEGVGFRADGEENAWRAHSAMYSPEARKAMTSETRGQNSWVNYGPHGEHNRTARSEDTHYADQKIGILPDWAITEGAGDYTGIAEETAQRFRDAGRPALESELNGQITEAFYDTMAKAFGKTPEEMAQQFPLSSVTREAPGAGALEQKVIHLGDVREQRKLQAFANDLFSTIRQRAQTLSEATSAAMKKGIFGDMKVGDRLRSQNSAGKPLPPMKIEGLFLRRWTGSKGQSMPFDRKGINPTIVEYNGERYIPMARVLQGEEGKGDWSRSEVPVDLVRDRQMTGPRAMPTLYQTDIPKYHPVTAYLENPASSDIARIAKRALEMDSNPDNLALIIDNDQALYNEARNILQRNYSYNPDNIEANGGVGGSIQSIIEKNVPSEEDWLAAKQRQLALPQQGAPTFYSAVQKAVTSSKNAKANADQWIATLKNTPGIKQEEMDWIGLEPWLRSQGKPVTKQELTDFINANQIKVGERRLSSSYYDESSRRGGWDGEGNEPEINIGNWEANEPDWDWITERAAHDFPEYIQNKLDDLIEEKANELGVPDEEIQRLFGPPLTHPDLFDGETPMNTLTPEEIAMRDELQAQAKEEGEQAAIDQSEKDYYDDPDQSVSVRVTMPDDSDRRFTVDRYSYGEGQIYDNDRGVEVDHDGDFSDEGIQQAIREHLADELDQMNAANEEEIGAAQQEALESPDNVFHGSTHHDQWTLPGGQNYRELMLTLPENPRGEGYTHPSHFGGGAKNSLAHVRFKDRTDAKGNKTLFIEEIQSDWHQKGRDNGYLTESVEKARTRYREARDKDVLLTGGVNNARVKIAQRIYRERRPDASEVPSDAIILRVMHELGGDDLAAYEAALKSDEQYQSLLAAHEQARTEFNAAEEAYNNAAGKGYGAVPDAPFKTTWPELIVKRMIRWAADNNYDQIAWSPGYVHVERYNLAKVLKSIDYAPNEDGTYMVRFTDKRGSRVSLPDQFNHDRMSWEQINEVAGRSIADKIKAGEGHKPATIEQHDPNFALRDLHTLDGNNLVVGKEGMTEFYDRMIPSIANKLGKKFGTQVGRTEFDLPEKSYGEGPQKLNAPVLRIPEEMKQAARETGQPLFQTGKRGAIQFGPDNTSLISVLKSADASTGVHELSHRYLQMYRELASSADAPNSLKSDFGLVKQWWKTNAVHVAADSANREVTPALVHKMLDSGTTGNTTLDAAIERGLQEQWARAFESYLRDGKAPTSALKRAFEQFKQWLTSLYKSASDLNVHLSPEMKGVFDRMLGKGAQEATTAPPAVSATRTPNLIDQAAAGRLKAAVAATKEMKTTFTGPTSGPVGQMLKRRGATFPYDKSDAEVSSMIWKPGAAGAAAIEKVLKAAPNAKPAIEDAAILSMRQKTLKDGVVDPAKLAQWRASHAEALRAVPDLDKRLGDAVKATEAMQKAADAKAAAVKAVQQTAIGKLMKVSSDADVAAEVGSMLRSKTASRSMRELVAQAKRNPEALAGLRRSVIDHILTTLVDKDGNLSAARLQQFLGRTTPALREVMTPDQMNNLQALAHELKLTDRNVTAPGGGSNTAENLAARKRYTHGEPSLFQKLFIDSGIGSIVGGLFHFNNPSNLAVNIGAGVASGLGTHFLQAARLSGIHRVDDLIRAAMLDRELMVALLKRAPVTKEVENRLARIIAKGALLTTAIKEDEGRKDGYASGGRVMVDAA